MKRLVMIVMLITGCIGLANADRLMVDCRPDSLPFTLLVNYNKHTFYAGDDVCTVQKNVKNAPVISCSDNGHDYVAWALGYGDQTAVINGCYLSFFQGNN